MRRGRQRRLQSTLAAIQKQYGAGAVRKASQLGQATIPPNISTGFAELDAITGCGGIPLGAISLLNGRTTSGKLTLAYKILAQAQHSPQRKTPTHQVAILDLNRHIDPDYLVRCGVALEHLLVVRPTPGHAILDLLLDLVRSRKMRLVMVDGLASLHIAPSQMSDQLGHLNLALRQAGCGLLTVEETAPPWQRWLNLDRAWPLRQKAALHIEMQRERWLYQHEQLVGYSARARLRKSRWARGNLSARVEIVFNGTVKAQATW